VGRGTNLYLPSLVDPSHGGAKSKAAAFSKLETLGAMLVETSLFFVKIFAFLGTGVYLTFQSLT